MSDETKLDSYILGEPHSRSIADIYADACKELLLPFPSTPIDVFPKFSKIVGGLRPYEFSILCGSTGTGKTTLNANLSKSLLLQGVPHYVASVETGHTDFSKRVMSAISGQDWNTGDPVPVDSLKNLHATHGHHFQSNHLHLSLYENRFSVETLMSEIAWHVKHHKVKVAIIDNLNFFLEVTRAADQIVEMDRVIHELIIFCKLVPVHLIMVMHPKKTESARVVSEFDIKGSSTAVQEAHNVFLFNRAGDDLIEGGFALAGDREIKIAKMRRKGRAVGTRIVLKARYGVEYFEGEAV